MIKKYLSSKHFVILINIYFSTTLVCFRFITGKAVNRLPTTTLKICLECLGQPWTQEIDKRTHKLWFNYYLEREQCIHDLQGDLHPGQPVHLVVTVGCIGQHYTSVEVYIHESVISKSENSLNHHVWTGWRLQTHTLVWATCTALAKGTQTGQRELAASIFAILYDWFCRIIH